MIDLLRHEHDKHLRIWAGVGELDTVDLSLVRLPAEALIFPRPIATRADLTELRDCGAVTSAFIHRARELGFSGMRFHDIRHSVVTMMLDQKIPLHTVAERIGDSPATILAELCPPHHRRRSSRCRYHRRTRGAGASGIATVAGLRSRFMPVCLPQ